MISKTWMIHQLGTDELLLPSMVNGALVANDMAKYFFTLLQVAKDHATNQEIDISDLKNERLACGIEDSVFDTVVKTSKKENQNIKIPHIKKILDNIIESIKKMILPLDIANSARISITYESTSYNERLEKILQRMTAVDEYISSQLIDEITSVQRNQNDSLHLLVMDLHKELNHIQSQIAQESIDGARVYGVTKDDHELIKSFMAGINQTIKLKFEHPGLGTTVTRSADTLVIQNDIGTTDAHVLVIHVKGNVVTLTYTDIHIDRLLFFHSLFEKFDITWNDTMSKKSTGIDGSVYHLSIGTYSAKNSDDLKAYLKFLGSRIVFLIDWNRARKQLRKFVKKKDTIMILKWAADNHYGHRGFLELGGAQLLFDTIEQISKGSLRFGESLYQAIGEENAIELLKFILKTTTEGILEGRSMLLLRDEVRTELMNYLRTAHQGFLDVVINHASFVLEIMTSVREGLLESRGIRSSEIMEKNAKRAQKWEQKGDELVKKAREMVKKENYPKIVEEIIVLSDDVADSLEETAFMLTLIPNKEMSENLYQSLNDQADLALQCSREYLKAVENARYVHRGISREDMEDFLHAIDGIITIEHQADEASRSLRVVIMQESIDFKELHLFSQISQNMEDSIDKMTRLAFRIREYVLENLMVM
ncbi:MAG: hypothetical protein KGI28_04495 [Thaumarchaeota archaeon]|nr:hypothetical protein [Nitrososphaerota archaeon]